MKANENLLDTPIELNGIGGRGYRRVPFYMEVEQQLKLGIQPNVFLYAGLNCWGRALARRDVLGPGTALVLPDGEKPSALRWPPIDSLVVVWPNYGTQDHKMKIELAQALIRDGVRFIVIDHYPECLSVWRKENEND